MSEYQYFEFQAIDRPLTTKEMAVLRSYSTRATITPSSFVNHYEWGNFKGDEDAWMDRYFDAFMYMANWGDNILKLRIPSKRLSVADARAYVAGDSVRVREKLGNVVVTLASHDEAGNSFEEHPTLSSLVSLRADVVRGDRRALYLGWLSGVQNESVDEDDLEPPVPPGLGKLNASLAELVEFLRIDEALVAMAARASSPMLAAPSRKEVVAWIKRLPVARKDAALVSIVTDDPAAAAELRERFHGDHRPAIRGVARQARRTVRQILT